LIPGSEGDSRPKAGTQGSCLEQLFMPHTCRSQYTPESAQEVGQPTFAWMRRPARMLRLRSFDVMVGNREDRLEIDVGQVTVRYALLQGQLMLSRRVVMLVRVQGRRRRAARARSSTSSISCHCGCHFCHGHFRTSCATRSGATRPPSNRGRHLRQFLAAMMTSRPQLHGQCDAKPEISQSSAPVATPCRLGFCSDPFSGDRHRYLTNAVEQLDDQRHERCRRDTVQRHSEAGEGSGYLILLKGASGGDAVARQTHRETASVPLPNAR